MEQLFQFIKGIYNNDKSITIYAVSGGKVHKIKVVGFEPYFYVPQDNSVPDDEDIIQIESGFIHEDGFPVKKIIVSSPNVVHSRFKSLRDQFTQHYEADIPFIRRFLIDTGITSGFRIKGSRNDIVSYQDLIPETYTAPPKICYVDFEENVTTRFVNPDNPKNEVTAWTAFCTPENHYITCILNPTLNEEKIVEQWEEDHTVIHVKKETTLLQLFDSYLKSQQPHSLAYWYGEVADYKYPEARGKKIGVNVDFEPYDRIDLCKGYEIRFKRLYYRLKDVAIDEGIYEPSELVAEEFHKDFWQEYVQNFIPGNTEHNKTLKFPQYSKMDVQILVILDLLGWEHYDEIKEKIKKESPREICSDILNLKSFAGLEDASATFYNSVSIDTFTLRKAHKKHIVLNSSSKEGGESFHAAEPFCPPEGIYINIKTIDMSRYYPNIILGYTIDELMCEVVNELNTLRDIYEAKIDQLKSDGFDVDSPQVRAMEKRRDNVKFLLNTSFGYLGSPRSRKYKREKASKITAKARLGLNVIKTAMEMRNIPVLYGHTDSIFIQCKDEEFEELLHYLNNVVLANHCKEERIPQLLRLKLEKICSKGLFVDAKGTKGIGAKARYALLVCLANIRQNIIWTSRGKNRPVGDIKIGDKLMCIDNNGNISETEVKTIFERDCENYLRIVFEKRKGKKGQSPHNLAIWATKEHPFYVDKNWIVAEQLKVGDELYFTSKFEKQKLQLKVDENFVKCRKAKKLVISEEEKIRRSIRRKEYCKNHREEVLNHMREITKNRTYEDYLKSRETMAKRGRYKESSIRMKKNNPMFNEEFRKKSTQKRIKRPTFVENRLIKIIEKYALPLEYVGNGKFWVGEPFQKNGCILSGLGRRKSPDFKVKNQRKVIEVYVPGSFGRGVEYENSKIRHFEKYGYKCLCIPIEKHREINESELLIKINNFIYNGVKIISIEKRRKKVKAINFHCEPYNNYFINGILTHNCWEKGKETDYVDIVGFDYIRGNTSPVARKVQMNIITAILRGNEQSIPAFIQKIVKDVKGGKYTFEKIATPITIGKPLNQYNPNIHHIKAAYWSINNLGLEIIVGDRIKLLPVKRVVGKQPTDVIAFFDEENLKNLNFIPDYDKVVEKTIYSKIEQFLNLVHITRRDIEGHYNIEKDWF